MFELQLMGIKAASLARLLRPAAALGAAGGLGAAIGASTATPAQPQAPPATPPDPDPEKPQDRMPGDARLAGRKMLLDRVRLGLGRTARKITAPYTGTPQ